MSVECTTDPNRLAEACKMLPLGNMLAGTLVAVIYGSALRDAADGCRWNMEPVKIISDTGIPPHTARESVIRHRFVCFFSQRQQGQCSFNKDYAIANISEWAILPKNEDALAFALWKVGPLPVSINAAPKSFQLYSNGIYDDEASCDNSKVNHAMLLLGYTKDYWILKNWWGSWGEDGYMRLARGKNLCGISNYAGYVTV
ncbi:LOW QUALITY PROTEIN: cathepsin K-like [Anopheles maculipalpis]|uniref:LOW QUALITY PROTEIN: cathepsin K-like n=1 Tax=Anopheles maculipalpis TaxID=1496333 RepID=UPI0021591B99|nr:LOW QUALITY PROTEIN: cathepsin K-like [Anopheles maculipalpis]